MNDAPEPIQALQRFIHDSIPLARAIGLTLVAWDGDCLAMHAPLAPNVNDKGCAFGGSLASVMTLAGWSLLELALQARGIACDVFVADSELAYLAPVWADFRAEARLDGGDWTGFFDALQSRGKARIGVTCSVREQAGETIAATLRARFVAKRRDPAPAMPRGDAAQ